MLLRWPKIVKGTKVLVTVKMDSSMVNIRQRVRRFALKRVMVLKAVTVKRKDKVGWAQFLIIPSIHLPSHMPNISPRIKKQDRCWYNRTNCIHRLGQRLCLTEIRTVLFLQHRKRFLMLLQN
jgi:hypothetical protein